MSLNQICSNLGTNKFLPDVAFKTSNVDTVKLGTGSAANPSLCFQGETDTGLYSAGNGIIGTTCNGQLVQQIDAVNKLNQLLPARFVDNFASPNAQLIAYDDNQRGALFISGVNGGYISFGEPLNDNFDMRLFTDAGGVNTCALKAPLTFLDNTYTDQSFQVDTTNKGVKFPVNTATPTGYAPSILNVYQETSLAPAWANIGTITSGDGKIKLTRVGKNITITINKLIGTTNNDVIFIPAGTIPEIFRPLTTTCQMVRVQDNSVIQVGSLDILADGSVSFSNDPVPGSVFPANAGSGWPEQVSISYTL